MGPGRVIGEKRLNVLEVSDADAAFGAELPRFVEAIRQIFEPTEIRAYLDGVRRVGAIVSQPVDPSIQQAAKAAGWPDDVGHRRDPG